MVLLKIHTYFFLLIPLFFGSCSLFEEEPEPLLSSIDGKEYYETKDGLMNARKATLLILEGKRDSVNFDMKITILDSLESLDSTWKDRYLKAFSIVLGDVYENKSTYVENRAFSFFIHYPNELITHLNDEGFDEIDRWMLVLSRGYKFATKPDDITLNSVANATLSNCNQCGETKQKLIVNFIKKLDTYEDI